MSSNIKEHVQQLDTALSKQKDAWAAWRDAATKARFAAAIFATTLVIRDHLSTGGIERCLEANRGNICPTASVPP